MSLQLVSLDPVARRSTALPNFVCSWTHRGLDAAWAHLAGDLDMASAPELDAGLQEPQARLVVLDLRHLAFMDSSGARVIAAASIRARRAGRRLIVLRGPEQVDRLFALTRSLDDVEVQDLPPTEPPIHVLRRLAEAESSY